MRHAHLGPDCDRRTFLKSMAVLAALNSSLTACKTTRQWAPQANLRTKTPGVVRGAFFYPPADLVLAGKNEDSWSKHEWFTWPGNQYLPEEQQAKFMGQLERINAGLNLTLAIDESPICTDAGIHAFIANIQASKPDALLLFNFWNSFSGKIAPILDAYNGPIILYHPLGANHQLPPEKFRTAPRVQYIHSIENWDALERGLRAVHTKNRMAQSRLLRVSGKIQQEMDEVEPFFHTAIHSVPAEHFNTLFDETPINEELLALARQVRTQAEDVIDLSDEAFSDAVRAHAAVHELMARHDADAITIECLFLKHRKPCLSFAMNNGSLIPCGCENDLNATLTLMLGSNLLGCGGFQHNPEFDTEENLYFASHCTCLPKLHGPEGKDAPYLLRPFFHQMPKSLALDVQWPSGEPVTLCKYHSGEKGLDAWAGEVVMSPTCPPTGGCATRVLVKMRDVKDVCDIYPGPHPVLFCGDFARCFQAFANLYELELRTNC